MATAKGGTARPAAGAACGPNGWPGLQGLDHPDQITER